MTELSNSQFSLVYNMLSLTIASMGAAFIFFVVGRSQVGAKYRPALLVSALVVAIACYHYFRIFNSFEDAYALSASGTYAPTGKPFNDAYRYVDWLLTVPLLLVELIAVMQLKGKESEGTLGKLAIAAFLMIALGYPGEVIKDDMMMRGVWGALSSIPFVYILYVLWVKLGDAIGKETERVQVLVRNIRLLLLATWGFYPITYMLPMVGIQAESALVGVQVGYAIADILAKAGYGVMIYAIARAKSEADGSLPDHSHA
jgi:bacteriorhodopsin